MTPDSSKSRTQPLERDKATLTASLRAPAVLAAVITAVLGPLIVLLMTRVMEPGTIKKTKDDISAITVSDATLRRLGGSIVFLRAPDGAGATGFVWQKRFVVTTSRLAGTQSEAVTVYRRKGLLEERRDIGHVRVVDGTNLISVIDMSHALDEVTLPAPAESSPQVFDKVFALVYADTTYLTLREGRVLSLTANRGNGRVVIAADFPVTEGMAGAPVFTKDGEVVGMITGADSKMQLTYIASIRRIRYSFESIGG